MRVNGFAVLAKSISEAKEPLTKGKELLLERYMKTAGVRETSVRSAAEFEIVRSHIVQAMYEAMRQDTIDTACGGTAWLEAAALGPEIAEANAQRARFLSDGLGQRLRDSQPPEVVRRDDRQLRIRIEDNAIGYARFLGSVRQYVPGVGYAVSVRKRNGENQDSFVLSCEKGRKMLAIADGCGSAKFSAIASHMAVREMRWSEAPGITKRQISKASKDIAWLLNDDAVLNGCAMNGTTTLVVALLGDERSRVLKIGNSLAFWVRKGDDGAAIGVLDKGPGPGPAVGQRQPLAETDIEEYALEGGRIVLTSDGVTNYLADSAAEIKRWSSLADDPVFIAERLLRSVLTRQVECDHADDVTIVVQDTGEWTRELV
ncbi:protein phosphatase 2C domain-containing protein [Candidatus Micrarchaeota archaeon]|nr:protein phosphatase 2C domain-containing protein [Candidatus Micrarchaeota archaeon]